MLRRATTNQVTGDETEDLVLLCRSPASLQVYEGIIINGKLSFGSQSTTDLSGFALEFARNLDVDFADLDGNGLEDLVLRLDNSELTERTLAILYANGTGGFTQGQTFTFSISSVGSLLPTGVAFLNADSDADLDIVAVGDATDFAEELVLLTNAGGGPSDRFSAPQILSDGATFASATRALAPVVLADGSPALFRSAEFQFEVYSADLTQLIFGQQVDDGAIRAFGADVNGDLLEDIVGLSSDTQFITLTNSGNDEFSLRSFALEGRPNDGRLIDVNRDGVDDLVAFTTAGVEAAIAETLNGAPTGRFSSSERIIGCDGTTVGVANEVDETVAVRALTACDGDWTVLDNGQAAAPPLFQPSLFTGRNRLSFLGEAQLADLDLDGHVDLAAAFDGDLGSLGGLTGTPLGFVGELDRVIRARTVDTG
ncbi:MAG: hypothetical protein AAFX94_16230, partial [Myxococcota bacterium]